MPEVSLAKFTMAFRGAHSVVTIGQQLRATLRGIGHIPRHPNQAAQIQFMDRQLNLRPNIRAISLRKFLAAICILCSVLAPMRSEAFEFLVQERGPASVTLQTDIAVAITAEGVAPAISAVVVESDNPDQKVGVAVYLTERIANRSLAAIGKAVRASTANYAETDVSFYVADQRNEVWATANSAPKLEVKILGLDREQYLVAAQGVDTNKLRVGDRLIAEAVMTGKDGGAAQIIRNGKQYYWRQYDRDTETSQDARVTREKGRYWIRCCSGTRYLVTKTDIEVYDDTGFVRSGRRLK